MLVRLSINGHAVTAEERLLQNLHERIRDVREGPDGALALAMGHVTLTEFFVRREVPVTGLLGFGDGATT